jgi:hypothetical protein
METPISKARDLALAFARALVESRYAHAANMLSPSMQLNWPSSRLKDTYEGMVGDFKDTSLAVEVEQTLETWPTKQPTHVAWFYLSISGTSCSEAVSVVVGAENAAHQIDSIEWGRP